MENIDCWSIIARKLAEGRSAIAIARDAASLVIAGVDPRATVAMWEAVDSAMTTARGLNELCFEEEFIAEKRRGDAMIDALLKACDTNDDVAASDEIVSRYCPVRRSVAHRLCGLSKITLKRERKRDAPGKGRVPLLEVEGRRGPPAHLKDVDSLYERHGMVRPVRIRVEWDAKRHIAEAVLAAHALPTRAALWTKIRYCTDVSAVIAKVAAVIGELGVYAHELFAGDFRTPKWPNHCPIWSSLRERALATGCDQGLPLIFDVEDIHAARRGDPGRPNVVTPTEVNDADFILRAVALDSTCHDGDSNCDMLREDDGARHKRCWERIRLWGEDEEYVHHACETCEHLRGMGRPMLVTLEQFAVPYFDAAGKLARRCIDTSDSDGEGYYNRAYSQYGSMIYEGDSHYCYTSTGTVDAATMDSMQTLLDKKRGGRSVGASDNMLAFLRRYVDAPGVRVEYVQRWDN